MSQPVPSVLPKHLLAAAGWLRSGPHEGDDRRLRLFGLVPIMWSTGAGADVMKRIAAPMIGASSLRSSWT